MQASDSAQAMIDSLWAIAEKHTPLHPEDLKRKSALVAFLDAFWHLDSETFFGILRTARDGSGGRFAEEALRLRQFL
jgi:hypothetical protein